MGFSDLFDADFGRGLITGFSETVTKDIEEGQKQGRKFIDDMRKGAVTRARAAEEKRQEAFDKVSEDLDKLAGLNFVNGNYDQARSLYGTLGKSSEQVNEFVVNTVPTAEAFAAENGETINWNTAVKFADADPAATPLTRLQAINSLVSGRKGIYTGDISNAQLPTSGWLSLLGDSDKDMRRTIEAGLEAEGFKTGDEVPLTAFVPATFDQKVLRPDAIVAARLARLQADLTENKILQGNAQIGLAQARKEELDIKIGQMPKEFQATMDQFKINNETLQAKLDIYNEFEPREKRLALEKLANDSTRAAAGSTAEAGYTFALVREKQLSVALANMERTGTDYGEGGVITGAYALAKDELAAIVATQQKLGGMLDSESQTEIFSKMNPFTAFNGFYETALRTMTNAKFTPGVDGKLAQVFDGNKLAGIRAMGHAVESFKNTFSKVGPAYQGIINNMVENVRSQVDFGGQQFLEREVSKYNIEMAGPSGLTGISVQNYYNKDGVPSWANSSLLAYDSPLMDNKTGNKRGKILYALNPKGVSQAQQIAQDNLLKTFKIDPKKLIDDPNTRDVDESIVYALYAGNNEWVFPPAN